MTNVLIILTLPEPVRLRYLNGIRDKFPELKIDMVDHAAKADPYIGAADVLITFGPMLVDRAGALLGKAARLKWVQALGTGVDNIADVPDLNRDVVITNIHGIHGPAMSEAAIAAMLTLARDVPRVVRNQGDRKWERWPARLIDGTTVGIFGVGAIAANLAPKCKALGMTVVGITSTKRAMAHFDRIYGREELLTAVRELDYLVMLTPYSPETHNLVGEAVFQAMKRTSFLINLARGGVVDEAALLRALQDGSIAGAALDVFHQEPLPADHPFWAMKNVVITPHLGGFYDRYPDHALPTILANMRKFLDGETKTMINLITR